MRIVLPAADQSVVIENIRWGDLEAILEELGDARGRRVAYDGGRLEIMSPSPLHDRIAEILGLLLRGLAEEFGLEVVCTRSWTLRRAGIERAVEADSTFYVGNEGRVRSLAGSDLDLSRDPPPDIAIEVEVTRKSIPRFPIYAALGVPEIWRYAERVLEIWQLRGTGCERTDESRCFPGFPVTELARFVELGTSRTMGDLRLAREFRAWAAETIGRTGNGEPRADLERE